MRVHGQTAIWGSHVGTHRPVGSLDWLKRLRQWFASHITHRKHATPEPQSGRWDSRPRHFRPPTTESALEHAAVHSGPAVSLALYGAII